MTREANQGQVPGRHAGSGEAPSRTKRASPFCRGRFRLTHRTGQSP
jgi:hypothetical protein